MGSKHVRRLVFVLLISSLSLSCTQYWYRLMGNNVRNGVSSSLVDYLYPKGEIPPEYDEKVPNLLLPLRVGLAFVPSRSNTVEGLSEAHKTELLETVKKSFSGPDFIREIMIIPDTYMRSTKGFEGVDQVARLYGLDVMALVSYDQVTHVDDTKASILYWTVVGAYFVKGSKNDVQTFVDTAVFDVKTHKLLFRAPGVNRVEATSTLINSPEKMRSARENSFTLAMNDMTGNLHKELDRFKDRIQKDKSVTISGREGFSMGSFDLDTIFLLTLLGVAKYFTPVFKRKRRSSSWNHAA